MTSQRSTILVTFAEGNERWRRTGRRLAREGRDSGWFHSVELYDGARMAREFPEFFDERPLLFNPTSHAFGYWSWKAFLLNRLAETAERSAKRILYLDAGSHLNVTPVSSRRFRDYEERVDRQGVLLMSMPHLAEQEWTKPSVLDYFGLTTNQREAGQIMGQVL